MGACMGERVADLAQNHRRNGGGRSSVRATRLHVSGGAAPSGISDPRVGLDLLQYNMRNKARSGPRGIAPMSG